MKQAPELREVQHRMQAGHITRDGFLGTDRRPLSQILEEDANTVNRLGLTHRQIAERMAHFTEAGKAGLGTTVLVEEHYEVRVEAVRGMLPCPWGHRGLYPKINVFLENTQAGREMVWTALTVHLVGEHGFYEGRGSPFRIEPEDAKEALGL
jgi:hypothetical protein